MRALRYFRSDGNIARLRGMLDDPGWAMVAFAQDNRGVEVRSYGIRQGAYDILRSWGVDVERPVVRQEVPNP